MSLASVQKMRTEGYADLPYPAALRSSVARAREVWEKDFLSLPDEIRNRFKYKPDNLKGNSGSGYEPPSSDKWDARKHTFHAKLADASWLRHMAEDVHPSAERLVEVSLGLLEEMKPFIADSFAAAFEREFDVGAFRKDILEGFDECIVRWLWYPPGYEVGEVIAAHHPDKGLSTLHLTESCAGVRRLTRDKKWVEFPVSDDKAVVFAGMRMQYRTRCDVKALCHEVRAVEETARIGRVSGVLFMNCNGTPYYDKARLGSTQSHEAGFNYDMPFEEFSRLFAQVHEPA